MCIESHAATPTAAPSPQHDGQMNLLKIEKKTCKHEPSPLWAILLFFSTAETEWGKYCCFNSSVSSVQSSWHKVNQTKHQKFDPIHEITDSVHWCHIIALQRRMETFRMRRELTMLSHWLCATALGMRSLKGYSNNPINHKCGSCQ